MTGSPNPCAPYLTSPSTQPSVRFWNWVGGTLLAKINIKHAFILLPVHPPRLPSAGYALVKPDICGHLPSIWVTVRTQAIQPPSRPTVMDLRAAQSYPPLPLLERFPSVGPSTDTRMPQQYARGTIAMWPAWYSSIPRESWRTSRLPHVSRNYTRHKHNGSSSASGQAKLYPQINTTMDSEKESN